MAVNTLLINRKKKLTENFISTIHILKLLEISKILDFIKSLQNTTHKNYFTKYENAISQSTCLYLHKKYIDHK